MIDSRDVAAVAAQIATNPAPHKDKTYWLTGPESLSYADAAAILSKVLGRPIGFRPLTEEEQAQAMINVGVPEQIAQMNTKHSPSLPKATPIGSPTTYPQSSDGQPGALSSSPPTTPQRSHEAHLTAQPHQ